MSIPDLNLLLVLHTVLTEKNVARAADRLHVTPSAVSNALARLRDALGDPLVTRKGRGIVPTPRALEIGPVIARTLGELESTFSRAPFDPAACTRTFTLAIADAGQTIWGPRIAKAMQKEMPRASLRIVGIEGLLALGDLGASEVDVHVGMPASGPGIHVARLFAESATLVARRTHPATKRRLTKEALGQLRHVRVEMVAGKSFRDAFTTAFAKAGIARTVVVTVPSFGAAAEIVASTELVTMLPASFFAAKSKALGLREVKAPFSSGTVEMAMCWHERTHGDPAARAFRALLRATVR